MKCAYERYAKDMRLLQAIGKLSNTSYFCNIFSIALDKKDH